MLRDYDILVRSKDTGEIMLLCEVKWYESELEKAELRLKQAMSRMSCPLGLLFTPKILRVYMDRYTSDLPAQSVELIGEFDSRPLLRPYDPDGVQSESEFQAIVQRWLETLPELFSDQNVENEKLASVIRTFVMPSVASGRVGAAAPRYL